MHVSAIITAAGLGTRFGGPRPKQLATLGGRPILQRSVEAFDLSDRVHDVTVALPPEILAAPPEYLSARRKPIELVEGGARRRDSVANAFARAASRAGIVVIHDAARPFVTPALIARTIDAAVEHGAAIAAIAATDTVKRAGADRLIRDTLPRGDIFLAQTPQAFRVDVLRKAMAQIDPSVEATDEAMLVELAGYPVKIVEGEPGNVKITTPDDLEIAERMLSRPVGGADASPLRIGVGYDLHVLAAGRPLILGGVTIPFDKGLQGHSDADAVCHAVTDAILGSAGAGDIGRHFPDMDPVWKDANSLDLLARAAQTMRRAGYAVVNIDVVVIAQRPKLLPYIEAMAANLARALGAVPEQVSIKGKTNEGVDSMGAGESIAVHAVALLIRRV